MKGKNRLVPRLLGVTKDSVLRLDEKTKEILKTWPLTTVRRWAASPNVFTLDFGDYQDQYYSVQTTEGEQISQLIAGYIDIILKRRQRKERIGDDGNEEEGLYIGGQSGVGQISDKTILELQDGPDVVRKTSSGIISKIKHLLRPRIFHELILRILAILINKLYIK